MLVNSRTIHNLHLTSCSTLLQVFRDRAQSIRNAACRILARCKRQPGDYLHLSAGVVCFRCFSDSIRLYGLGSPVPVLFDVCWCQSVSGGCVTRQWYFHLDDGADCHCFRHSSLVVWPCPAKPDSGSSEPEKNSCLVLGSDR